MTRHDIIAEMADRTGLTLPEAQISFEAALQIMTESFIKKEDVIIRGFGTFKYKKQKARTARDFKTGSPVVVPEKSTIKFCLSETLKQKLSYEG